MNAPFKKGQTVTMTMPGSKDKAAAVVTKSTSTDLEITVDVGGGMLKSVSSKKNRRSTSKLAADLQLVQGTDLPISQTLQAIIDAASGKLAPIKRGQIVSYDMEGEICTGRVEKGGKSPLVTYKGGGLIKGPARDFTPCKSPVIESDRELSDWDVETIKDEGAGQDGVRWRATVTFRNSPVFHAICDGSGAPLRYESIRGTDRAMIDQYIRDLKKYIESKGRKFIVADELWPHYRWSVAPTGISFIQYLNDL